MDTSAKYTERKIKKQFDKLIKVYPVIAIVGARQAGKTTFLKEQAKKFKSNYLLFDDPERERMMKTQEIRRT